MRWELSERYQKERDNEAVEPPETLKQDLEGCQKQQKDRDEATWITVEQASDEKSWDGLDNEQHHKLMKFYTTERSIGL